jgi:hypothetical protein
MKVPEKVSGTKSTRGKTTHDEVIGLTEPRTLTFTKESLRELDSIAAKVKKFAKQLDKSKIEIGRLLVQAKEIYGDHGDWELWLERNCELSLRTARRYMRIAEGVANMPALADFELTKIESLLKLKINDNTKLEGFIAENRIEELSSRKVEELVREHKPAKTKRAKRKQKPIADSPADLHEKVEFLKDMIKSLIAYVEGKYDADTMDALDTLQRLCNRTIDTIEQTRESNKENHSKAHLQM